jgi:predicted Zn-dependent protease
MSAQAFHRILPAVFSLLCALLVCPSSANAGTLDILGVRWEGKTELKVLINAGGGVSDAALDDVMTAIQDWNQELPANAPTLVPFVGNTKDADVIIRIKPGGGPTLGRTSWKTVSPFDCALRQATIQLSGKAFGEPFSTEGRLATARHELGHVYSLGHSDDPNDLMYFSGDPFSTDDIPISACDIAGVTLVYDADTCADIPDSLECN